MTWPRKPSLRKQEYDGYAASFQKEYESQHASVEQLKDALRQLQAKIEEASSKKNLLIARAKRAEAQKQIQQTMGSLSGNSSFDTFDRMAQKVDQVEAEAEAMKELGDGERGPEAGGQVQGAGVLRTPARTSSWRISRPRWARLKTKKKRNELGGSVRAARERACLTRLRVAESWR